MKHVVLIAPYFGKTMCEAIQSFLKLDSVRIGVISQQPLEQIPAFLQPHLQEHYQIQSCLDAALLQVAVEAFVEEWGRVDRLIGYLEHLQLPIAQVRSALNLPGMKQEVAERFRDKNKMKAALQSGGLPTAAQARIENLGDLHEFLERCGYPIVLKPLAGVGSKNTMRIASDEELYSALNVLLPSAEHPVQAEAFIQGEEFTMESVSIDGEVVWQSSTYYLPGPLTVIENPWIQYCVLLPREQEPVHAARFAQDNRAALKTLGIQTGLSHMEWFQEKSGRQLVSEVGARPPGVNIMPMMSIAHEVSFWDKWAELMVHHRWDVPERQYAVASVFLRAQGHGKSISNISGLEEIKEQLSPYIAAASIPRVGQPRSEHYEGDGWIILKHPETEKLVQAVRHLLNTLQVQS